jgi:hypothetical protein
MTVRELIDNLQQFDPEMLVAINYDISSEIEVKLRTWVHSNYPYDKPDVDFVSLE